MKKKALNKSTIREIFESKARFFSILGIILLGVCFYAGIKATGPDMIHTANEYFERKKLMDGKIVSTYGLTQADIDLLEKEDQISQVEALYSKDVNLTSDNHVVRLFSYDYHNQQQLNKYEVKKGRLPKKSGEIALDWKQTYNNTHKIGDKYIISSDKETMESFKVKEFTVVGFVNSPMYIENGARGNTMVGKGSIDYFAVVPKEDFNMKAYTEIYVRYKGLDNVDSYADTYQEKIDKKEKAVKKMLTKRPQERLNEVKNEAMKPINKAKNELEDGAKKILDARTELEERRKELIDGQIAQQEAEAIYYEKLRTGKAELEQKSIELNSGKIELQNKSRQLVAGKQQLDAASAQLGVARQQLEANGVNPETNIWIIQEQIQGIQAFVGQMDQGAQIISSSVQSLPVEEPIAEEVIATWNQAIINPLVDLSELTTMYSGLVGVPLTLDIQQMVIGSAQKLIAVGEEARQQMAPLQQLLEGVRPYQAGEQQYAAQLATYQQAVSQIQQAENQLANGEIALNQGYAQLEQAKSEGYAQLNVAKQKIEDGAKNLAAAEESIKIEEQKLLEAQEELAREEQKLADLAMPEYLYFQRKANPGFAEYRENAKRISSIATVFPVFFFMIAALICLTTMTRMVDEKRGEIGTLKALGYSNFEIAQKYIVYATLASLIGSALGLVIGYYVFPTVIFNAYGSLYNLPPVIIKFYTSYSVQSVVVALLCTLISAMVVLKVDLLSTPAILMRPKAPKAGKRILLERLSFIWKRLNFNQKVTARNLFRYKQRMLMTVFGIAGCMAMIITGFGLRDSITDVVSLQFDKLWHYQGIVTYNDDTTLKDEQQYDQTVKKLKGYQDRLPIAQTVLQIEKKGVTTQEVTVDVPKDREHLDDFILFNDRKTKEKYQLNDDGAIINEKIAKMFHLKEGDTFKLNDSEHKTYEVKVDKIVENYAMHFVYMTPKYYEKVFAKTPEYNADLLLFKEKPTKTQEEKISQRLMKEPQVVNVTFLSQTSGAMDDTIQSLNIVVWVLIISAAALAFIVLYNLTNINISERIRELSTIKVLGFYNNEVTMYVYRENNILTVLGILVGCLAGKLLHGFVLQTAEVDILMFSPVIHGRSYLYSALLTIFFSFLVMLVMHRKLRKVDMIEALKSNE